MANQNAQKLSVIPKNGSNGDACVFASSFQAVATPISDVIRFAKMPAGVEIIGVDLVHDAMGASSTLSVGYEFVDSADGAAAPAQFLAAAASTSAQKRPCAAHPIELQAPTFITATVGGAAITGKVTAIVNYKFIGTK
jgi:hypothetical protein